MDKETARRSLDEFLRRLPNGAVVEIVEHEEPPPPGVGVRVKIDMWTNPDRRQRAEVRGRHPSRAPGGGPQRQYNASIQALGCPGGDGTLETVQDQES